MHSFPRTVFSIDINIPGYIIHDFSDLNISRACDGMGTKGIVMTELRFSAYGVKADAHARAPEVFVRVTKGDDELSLPRFWLDTHTVHNGRIDFVCYDRMAFADSTKFTENDLTLFGVDAEAINLRKKELKAELKNGSITQEYYTAQMTALDAQLNKKVSSSDIVNVIAQKMNLTPGGFSGDVTAKTDINSIPGTSCSDWLQRISEANCGFFYITNDDSLAFCRFFGVTDTVRVKDDAYTLPDIGETVTADGYVIYGDSGQVWDRSAGADYILQINGGSLADKNTPELLGDLLDANEPTYTYGSIEKALLTNFPYCNSSWSGCNGDLRINNISAVISSFGILASLSANQSTVGEIGEFMGIQSRRLEAALKNGEKLGKHLVHTRYQGVYWEDDEEDEESGG